MVDYLAIFFSFIIIIIIIIWKWKIIHHHHYHFSSADTIIQSIVSYNGYTPILGVQSNVCVCVWFVLSIIHPLYIIQSSIIIEKKEIFRLMTDELLFFPLSTKKKHVVVCVCVCVKNLIDKEWKWKTSFFSFLNPEFIHV